MNRRPSDVDARLAAWLEEGPTSGPDEVLSRTFARARSTRQDRVWLDRIPQPTRFQMMSATISLTAVAVLALAVGVALAPDTPEVAAPAPSASPSPAPSASPPTQLHQGSLTPGDYTVAPFGGAEWAPCGPSEEPCPEAATDDDIRFTFTVPEGWAGAPFGSDIWLAAEHNSGPDGAGFLIGRGGWLYSDPCAESGDPDIPVGPTVDDFVERAGRASRARAQRPGRRHARRLSGHVPGAAGAGGSHRLPVLPGLGTDLLRPGGQQPPAHLGHRRRRRQGRHPWLGVPRHRTRALGGAPRDRGVHAHRA